MIWITSTRGSKFFILCIWGLDQFNSYSVVNHIHFKKTFSFNFITYNLTKLNGLQAGGKWHVWKHYIGYIGSGKGQGLLQTILTLFRYTWEHFFNHFYKHITRTLTDIFGIRFVRNTEIIRGFQNTFVNSSVVIRFLYSRNLLLQSILVLFT